MASGTKVYFMIHAGDAFPDATLTESTEFGEACPLAPQKLSAAALARGKKKWDKREDIARREAQREAARAVKLRAR